MLYADAGRLMLVCSATSRVSRSRVSRFRAQITQEARTGRGSVPESVGLEAQQGPFVQRAAPISLAARAPQLFLASASPG
eukprot:3925506-Alexandrium_andersonii.AAC.1